MFDVNILGVGGGMPMPGRYLSSIMVGYKGNKILIDCGEGTQVAMKEYSTGFSSLGLILLTHMHGDHINGLPGFLATLGNYGRSEKVTVVGPKGVKKIFEAINIMVPYVAFEVEIIEIDNEDFSYEYKGVVIKSMFLDHSAECIGYSMEVKRAPKFIRENAERLNIPNKYWKELQSGKDILLDGNIIEAKQVLGEQRTGLKLSYITDTRPIDSIKKFIDKSDLFFCEGNYESYEKIEKAKENKHMTFEEAAKLALDGNVEKMILTHFSPSIEEPKDFIKNAKEIFRESYIGNQGDQISLNFK